MALRVALCLLIVAVAAAVQVESAAFQKILLVLILASPITSAVRASATAKASAAPRLVLKMGLPVPIPANVARDIATAKINADLLLAQPMVSIALAPRASVAREFVAQANAARLLAQPTVMIVGILVIVVLGSAILMEYAGLDVKIMMLFATIIGSAVLGIVLLLMETTEQKDVKTTIFIPAPTKGAIVHIAALLGREFIIARVLFAHQAL